MNLDIAPLSELELESLPVFPLPRVVFFPGTSLPLHLFEPRYVAMIEDCIERGPMTMAVARLVDGYEPVYEGRPAIHTIAGAGRIIAHERLDNGTYNIVLHGLARVSLEEIPDETSLYRRAKATVLEDQRPPGGVSPSEYRALLTCASAVAAAVQKQHPDFTLGVSAEDSPARLADVLADRFVADSAKRQTILETLDVGERVRVVTESVGEVLALLAGRTGGRGKLVD